MPQDKYSHKNNWTKASKIEKHSYTGYQTFALQMFLKYILTRVYTWCLTRSCTNSTNLANWLSIHLVDHDWSHLCCSRDLYRDKKCVQGNCKSRAVSEGSVERQRAWDRGKKELEVWAQIRPLQACDCGQVCWSSQGYFIHPSDKGYSSGHFYVTNLGWRLN